MRCSSRAIPWNIRQKPKHCSFWVAGSAAIFARQSRTFAWRGRRSSNPRLRRGRPSVNQPNEAPTVEVRGAVEELTALLERVRLEDGLHDSLLSGCAVRTTA